MKPVRTAIIGAGSFGRNHVRVVSSLPAAQLTAVVDSDPTRLTALSIEGHTPRLLGNIEQLPGLVDAAIVSTPTNTHEHIATFLLTNGIDVLVEKPIAATSAAGERLTRLAEAHGRILQVGHLERFNPAITALEQALTVPLFFEVHRLSVFTPRSLDIDVVLDLMIHDLDIVLTLAGQSPSEIRAAGISVLTPKVDIANVRLAFPSGCIANLTASRVSTEQVRKLRVFQPHQYISVDYARQDAVCLAVQKATATGNQPGTPRIGFQSLAVSKAEPLQRELASFFQAVQERSVPHVTGAQATAALQIAEAILGKIKEHEDLVSQTLARSPRASAPGQP